MTKFIIADSTLDSNISRFHRAFQAWHITKFQCRQSTESFQTNSIANHGICIRSERHELYGGCAWRHSKRQGIGCAPRCSSEGETLISPSVKTPKFNHKSTVCGSLWSCVPSSSP